jgi:hypothetical protein
MPLQAASALATTPKLKMLNKILNNFMTTSPKVTFYMRQILTIRSIFLTLKQVKMHTGEQFDALGANIHAPSRASQ